MKMSVGGHKVAPGENSTGGGMVHTDPADCIIYSRRLRQGMENYELLPTELRLLHHLCLETFDAGIIRGRVNLEDWATKLRFREAKGLRADKLEKVFRSVVDLGIVDLNATRGTYELRPDPQMWSRARALYEVKKEPELPLCAERPLSESLSELSRENALGGVSVAAGERDWHALYSELGRAVQSGTVEEFKQKHPELFSAEKSAESSEILRRKNPPILNRQLPQGFACPQSFSAEKSAASALASSSMDIEGKLAKAKEDLPSKAIAWVKSVDFMGQLQDPIYGPQWQRICADYPGYVLSRLKRRFELKQKDPEKLLDPLAYLSRKAREEGRMPR